MFAWGARACTPRTLISICWHLGTMGSPAGSGKPGHLSRGFLAVRASGLRESGRDWRAVALSLSLSLSAPLARGFGVVAKDELSRRCLQTGSYDMQVLNAVIGLPLFQVWAEAGPKPSVLVVKTRAP